MSSHSTPLHHGLLVGCLACGAAVSAWALVWAVQRPPSLVVLSGGSYGLLVAALVLATSTGALALVARLRAWSSGRWTSRSLAPFRAGFAVFTLGTWTYLLWVQPFKGLYFVLFWGVACGAFAAACLLGPRLRAAQPVAMARLDRVLFTVCAVLIMTELGLRALALVFGSPLLAPVGSAEAVLSHYRLPPHAERFGFRCDARGYHDETPRPREQGRLVVTIGDSFSVGTTPHAMHYTTVCERLVPGLQVYNVGVTMAGPAEYVQMLREDAVPLRPDAIVIAIFVGNDVTDARRYRPDLPAARWWFDRNHVLLYQVTRRLIGIAVERGRRGGGAPIGRVQGAGVELRAAPSPGELRALFPWLADPFLEEAPFSRETYLAVENQRMRAACDPARDHLYEPMFAALEEMVALAGGVPLFVMLIPDEFQVEDALWDAVFEAHQPPAALERDRPQRLLAAWLADRRVPCLDLLPILRAVPPLRDGDRHLYHLRDTHFNARGNDVAGRALAAFLSARL